MGLCSDVAADLVEMHLHGACVGEGEHEGGALGPHAIRLSIFAPYSR